MVSCTGLTLSFADLHKLSRYFSLWRPSSPTFYNLSFHTHQQQFSRQYLLMTWRQNQVVVDGFFSIRCTAGNVAQGARRRGCWGNRRTCSRRKLKMDLTRGVMYIMISDVLMWMMWWCCLSQVTMATITMTTGGWLLLVVMMSIMMTVSSWPVATVGPCKLMSRRIRMPPGIELGLHRIY